MKKNILFLILTIFTPYININSNSIINLEQIKNIFNNNKTSCITCLAALTTIYTAYKILKILANIDKLNSRIENIERFDTRIANKTNNIESRLFRVECANSSSINNSWRSFRY